MFSGCGYTGGLKSLDVSAFHTGSVTDMSGMFDGCSGLTSLNVSGIRTENVSNMARMFMSCEKLTDLDVTSLIQAM